MNNTKIITWQDLKDAVNQIPVEQLNKKVRIFNYPMGELDNIVGLNYVGNNRRLENQGNLYSSKRKNSPYLLMGVNFKTTESWNCEDPEGL